MDPLARLMDGTPLPGVLGATRDARPRGALVHASLAAAPAIGDKKGRHLTGTFCLTGDTMEGIIQCLVFLKAFSVSAALTCVSFVRLVLILIYRNDFSLKECTWFVMVGITIFAFVMSYKTLLE